MDHEWSGKTIFKKIRSKTKKKQKINVKLPQVNKKPLVGKIWLRKTKEKLGLEKTFNRLRQPFRKIGFKRIEKWVRIKVNLRHVKKTLARKRMFVRTLFFLSTLKLEQKKFTLKNHSLFCFTSCFGVTKFTTLIWFDFRNHENVWTYLKKYSRKNSRNHSKWKSI